MILYLCDALLLRFSGFTSLVGPRLSRRHFPEQCKFHSNVAVGYPRAAFALYAARAIPPYSARRTLSRAPAHSQKRRPVWPLDRDGGSTAKTMEMTPLLISSDEGTEDGEPSGSTWSSRKDKSVANLQRYKSCPQCGHVYGNKMGGKAGGSQCVNMVPVLDAKGSPVLGSDGQPKKQRCPYVFVSIKQTRMIQRAGTSGGASASGHDPSSDHMKARQLKQVFYGTVVNKVRSQAPPPPANPAPCPSLLPVLRSLWPEPGRRLIHAHLGRESPLKARRGHSRVVGGAYVNH